MNKLPHPLTHVRGYEGKETVTPAKATPLRVFLVNTDYGEETAISANKLPGIIINTLSVYAFRKTMSPTRA